MSPWPSSDDPAPALTVIEESIDTPQGDQVERKAATTAIPTAVQVIRSIAGQP
jgi:hypothetical protein